MDVGSRDKAVWVCRLAEIITYASHSTHTLDGGLFLAKKSHLGVMSAAFAQGIHWLEGLRRAVPIRILTPPVGECLI